jgi:hypothetical protein
MSEENQGTKSRVELANERRRKKSEISQILQDLDRLQSIPAERKKRWIWELLQNARDEAPPIGSDVIVRLKKTELSFIHNGKAFDVDSLLAIITRTSTKPFSETDDDSPPTGKYGTGFVTSHILNRIVGLRADFKNDEGVRPFNFKIDRTPTTFDGLKAILEDGFTKVDEIDILSPAPATGETVFSYGLENTFDLAEESLVEFAANLPFTLFINRAKISSITIENEYSNKTITFKITEDPRFYENCGFVRVGSANSGIIYWLHDKMILAVPAIKVGIDYHLTQITDKARFYKEFPLIGTEFAHIPFFVQSENFLPPETRDGLRTAKSVEAIPDHIADTNRTELILFKDQALLFFQKLSDLNVKNLHLLTESGLPIENLPYTGTAWYIEFIQEPLRKYFLELPLLNTISGKKIALIDALIPAQFTAPEHNKCFYELASLFNKEKFPDEQTYLDWQHIVMQDSESWGANLIFTADMLAAEINLEKLLQEFIEFDKIALWLNNLITFFYSIHRQDLCESAAIYMGRDNHLRVRKELAFAESLNPQIIGIGDHLEQRISKQLLHSQIKHIDGVTLFDVKGCYDKLNKFIGDLDPSKETESYYSAVVQINTIFAENSGKLRESWYLLIKQLLPDLTPDRTVVNNMSDFNWPPAEKAAIRYVSWLIGQSRTIESFEQTYFQSERASTLEWLNKFMDVLFRTQEYEEFLAKYPVILMQDGNFKQLTTTIHAEPENAPYNDFYKNLYTAHSGLGDVKSLLIAREIKNERLISKPLLSITEPVDDVFKAANAEKDVEKGGSLNDLFHKLNTYKPSDNEDLQKLFLTFSLKRLQLYSRAFGPEVSSMLMKMTELNKTVEDIEDIINLNMSVAELAALKRASDLAGGAAKLLVLAQQIADNAADAAWRKKVGDAAEDAFKEAIAGIAAFYIDNPDNGFDFEILKPGTDLTYFLEIKSTVSSKENIQMSSKQGTTARDNANKYALCVLNRLHFDDKVTKDYFIEHARFLLTVGEIVTKHVNGMEGALAGIRTLNEAEVGSFLDSEGYSVFVGKGQWIRGITFNEFVDFLKVSYFKFNEE